MANYLLDLKKKAKNSRGSTAAKNKLIKTGGTAKSSMKKKLAKRSALVGSAAAIAKLRKASTKAGAVKKLRSSGGSAITSRDDQMKAYRKRMKAGQKKSNLSRKPRSY
jgi:hypothetical protein